MAQIKMLCMMVYISLLLFAVITVAAPAPQYEAAAPASSYWLAQIKRQGTVPYGNNPSYQIFRNVKDFGAVGDGVTDDTDAINNAISTGNRCGLNCDSSTTTPALIYFPPGVYKVSAPIVMYYYSQLVGDATNLPTILGSGNFQGLAMLDADPYIPNGGGAQWYTNQNNFFRQVRNFIIDMRQMPAGADGNEVNGIHWQVAQATSLQNLRFEMRTGDSRQRGLFIENGSGGMISDLIFNNGRVGMYIGSQQFTTRNITFNNCNTAIFLIWDWLWTFKGLTINNCHTGLDMASLANGVNQTVGSAVVMDSKLTGVNIGISTAHSANSQPKTGGTLVIYNVDFSGARVAIATSDGQTILNGGAVVGSWAQGDAYLPQNGAQRVKRAPQPVPQDVQCPLMIKTETVVVTPIATITVYPSATSTDNASSSQSSIAYTSPNNTTLAGQTVAATCTRSAVSATSTTLQGLLTPPKLPTDLLDGGGAIFQRAKPQYETEPAASFLSIKSDGAKGDGITDDTQAVQASLNKASANGQIAYFDHGAYLITNTIQVPTNIRITGEIWPLIMISGSNFGDVNNPRPAFRVGNPGDTGTVEISDLIFETRGPAPGAIMMEWNVADREQGSVAMWDTHFRVGGTAGTLLQQDTCLANVTEHKVFRQECAGSFLMMHITQQATAYLENTWFWLADHELDMAGHNQTTIFNGRGILIESQGPTWLWGTASEHSVLYNYQINNAQNVFMGAIQTETAYFQGAPDALNGGFVPNSSYSDPDFSDCTGPSCKKTWGLRVLNSQDVYMFGGGLYSFFDDYQQTCLATEDCQENMVDIQCSTRVNLYGLVTKASTNMVNVNGQPVVLQKDHPNLFGATVALFEQL